MSGCIRVYDPDNAVWNPRGQPTPSLGQGKGSDARPSRRFSGGVR